MKKILIVVDMQNDFIDGVLGSKEAQAIVEGVAQKVADYKAHGFEILFTRDTHPAHYLKTEEGRNLPVAHCIENTPGWELSDRLDTEGATILNKPAFGSIELGAYLQSLPDFGLGGSGLEVELVGLCTDICVISNALLIKAFAPEAKVTVNASCCAGVTPESHNNALAAMEMCHVKVIHRP